MSFLPCVLLGLRLIAESLPVPGEASSGHKRQDCYGGPVLRHQCGLQDGRLLSGCEGEMAGSSFSMAKTLSSHPDSFFSSSTSFSKLLLLLLNLFLLLLLLFVPVSAQVCCVYQWKPHPACGRIGGGLAQALQQVSGSALSSCFGH